LTSRRRSPARSCAHHADYDESRRVWNRAVNRRPALIARPRDVAGVVRVVDFARDHDLPLAVRGGGHSPAGYGTVDDGVVVDLASMTRLDIDLAERTADAAAGLTWGEYNARTNEHGLATPGGDVANVGIAGLTLSGGMGWLMRRHGMTIDNLLEVDVVTAAGAVLTAGEAEYPDLFWALRGGGGNFGIATRFRYRLHPVETVVGGAIVYPATRPGLRGYAEAAAEAPDELTTITFVQKAPPLPFIPADAHGTPVHVLLPCFVGQPDRADDVLKPLRNLAGQAPLADTTGPMPYRALYDLTAMAAAPRPHTIRNTYLRGLTDDIVEILLDFVNRITSPFSLIALRELGGAVARVRVTRLPSRTATRLSTLRATAAGMRATRNRRATSHGPTTSSARLSRTRKAPTPASSTTRATPACAPPIRHRCTRGSPTSNDATTPTTCSG
jgi:FAD binding domain